MPISTATSRHRSRRGTARMLAGLLALATLVAPGMAPCVRAQGSVLQEVDAMRRAGHYREALALLDPMLATLQGEQRAQGLFLLARLASDHKEVRRLLREAAEESRDAKLQFQAHMELARLDYARGNYNSVRTRLRDESHPEAQMLVAQAWIALEQPRSAERLLRGLQAAELQSLLLGWCVRAVGDPQGALSVLEHLARDKTLSTRPTALLWKAECEAELGLRERALGTAATLQSTYPDAPEAILIEPTLATLRRQQSQTVTVPHPDGRVVLQLGAFEDRANALRFRDGLPRSIEPVFVEEVRSNARRWYRVHVGPFATRELAEDYARDNLDPLDLDWRLSRPEAP